MSQETVLVDYTNSSKESKPFLNTPIISTGVHNAVISGLSVPVSINFILDKKVTKPAIFWKYVLNLFHPKCFQEHLTYYHIHRTQAILDVSTTSLAPSQQLGSGLVTVFKASSMTITPSHVYQVFTIYSSV